MRSAAKPENEPERLQALQRYAILDTAPEGAYDDLLAIATAICGAPMGTVSLVDAERQWFKARRGVQAQETSRDVAFCAHTVLDATRVLEVPDAQIDERFHDNPLVTGGDRIRFYAGAPLVASDGHAVGALCVMDSQPHQLTEQQRDALSALSRQVVALMELRAAYAELRHHLGEREWYERELDARREALREENSTLSEQSRTDPLTGLANRRAFGEALKRDLHEGTPLAFAIVDVDLFKQINDGWGHPFGDRVLATVAKTLADTVGPQNFVGRIGGEEFALVMRHCDLKSGKALAEEVRKAVAALQMEVPITISVGVTARHEGDGPSELYSRADAALYEAKSGGRDRVTVG